MSENSEPFAVEQKTAAPESPEQQLSHGRILWTMALIVCVAAILSAFFVSLSFGSGLAIGGALAFVNYWWLKRSLRKIFDKAITSAETGERPRFLAGTYLLRYLGIGAVLGVVFLTGFVPIVAVLLGLCVFALAVLIEGFLRILSSISKREEF